MIILYNISILYSILTGQTQYIDIIEKRFKKVNIRHYLTWEENIEANCYGAILLQKENQVVSSEYSLGIKIRKILMYSYKKIYRANNQV